MLELGCGRGLPSILAIKLGAKSVCITGTTRTTRTETTMVHMRLGNHAYVFKDPTGSGAPLSCRTPACLLVYIAMDVYMYMYSVLLPACVRTRFWISAIARESC